MIGQQFGLAFDEIGTTQRRNTEVRLTHRWREMDWNSWSRHGETPLGAPSGTRTTDHLIIFLVEMCVGTSVQL